MTLLLNTLFVTAEKSAIHKDHEAAVVRVDGAERMRMPLIHLQAIVCFGPVWVSPELMFAMAERGPSLKEAERLKMRSSRSEYHWPVTVRTSWMTRRLRVSRSLSTDATR